MVLPAALPNTRPAATMMQSSLQRMPRRPPQGLPGMLGNVRDAMRGHGQALGGDPTLMGLRDMLGGQRPSFGAHGGAYNHGVLGTRDMYPSGKPHGNPDAGFGAGSTAHDAAWVKQQMGAMSPLQLSAFKSWTGAVGHQPPVGPRALPKKPVAADPMAGMDPVQRAKFQAWTAAAGGHGNPAGGPSWQEMLNWNNQRDAVNTNYLEGLAQNDYARSALQSQFGQEMYGLEHQNDLMRSQIPYGDMRRGMLTSGVYGHHLQDQATNYGMALRNMLGGQNGRMSDLSFRRQGLERRRAQGLGAVDQSEAYRRMQVAQMLGGQ